MQFYTMNARKILRTVALAASITTLSFSNAYAMNYKGKDFLADHPEASRNWFYVGSFMTLGHVVSLQNAELGNCIWSWYFQDADAKMAELESTMRKYPDHSPTAVIMSLMERDCGALPKGLAK